jgi:hypothetical protein
MLKEKRFIFVLCLFVAQAYLAQNVNKINYSVGLNYTEYGPVFPYSGSTIFGNEVINSSVTGYNEKGIGITNQINIKNWYLLLSPNLQIVNSTNVINYKLLFTNESQIQRSYLLNERFYGIGTNVTIGRKFNIHDWFKIGVALNTSIYYDISNSKENIFIPSDSEIEVRMITKSNNLFPASVSPQISCFKEINRFEVFFVFGFLQRNYSYDNSRFFSHELIYSTLVDEWNPYSLTTSSGYNPRNKYNLSFGFLYNIEKSNK